MEPVLGSAACWLAVTFRKMIKLSLLFRRPMIWLLDVNFSLRGRSDDVLLALK